MKYIVFLLLIVSAILLIRCGDCGNSRYYQIRMKNPSGDSKFLCQYKAEGIGTCAAWQKSEEVFFTDSCRLFSLSQIIPRTIVDKYRKGN